MMQGRGYRPLTQLVGARGSGTASGGPPFVGSRRPTRRAPVDVNNVFTTVIMDGEQWTFRRAPVVEGPGQDANSPCRGVCTGPPTQSGRARGAGLQSWRYLGGLPTFHELCHHKSYHLWRGGAPPGRVANLYEGAVCTTPPTLSVVARGRYGVSVLMWFQ